MDEKAKDDGTIFIRYRKGTLIPVAPDPAQKISEVIDLIGDQEDFRKTIKDILDGSGWGIAPESTWAQIVCELTRELDNVTPSNRQRWIPVVQQFLRLATDLSIPTPNRWNSLKEFTHKHIDLLSGWETSPYRAIASQWHVYRRDGGYFRDEAGETRQILGAKTGVEERADYIASSAGNSYGTLRGLLMIVALCNLQEAFEANPHNFPASMRVVLGEGDHWTSFLHWTWSLKWPYDLRPTRWRPNENFCDPDWLSNDLIAFIAEKEQLFHDDGHISRSPELHEKWHEKFGKSTRQTGFALETTLSLGKEEEEWIDLQGHTYRWKNQTASMYPTVIATHGPSESDDDVVRRTFRFLSHLSFVTDHGIEIKFWAGTSSGMNPSAINPKRSGASGYPAGYFQEVKGTSGQKLDFALSLYREGASSSSPYYAFLNFYKIVQIPGEKSPLVKDWIKANAPKMSHFAELDKTVLEQTYKGDVERYLRMSSKNAISHVGAEENKEILDPDNPEDQRKIRNDLLFMRELARYAIESGLL